MELLAIEFSTGRLLQVETRQCSTLIGASYRTEQSEARKPYGSEALYEVESLLQKKDTHTRADH